MIKSSFTILILLFWFISNGQNSNGAFEASKGTWRFPIANVESVDTLIKDCRGVPTNSIYLVLKSTCPQEVSAIQAGTVQAVIEIDSLFMVMVKSGDYYLTYFGLLRPQLKRGDAVQQHDKIAILGKEKNEDTYDLTLILLKEKKTLNINRWFDWKIDSSPEYFYF